MILPVRARVSAISGRSNTSRRDPLASRARTELNDQPRRKLAVMPDRSTPPGSSAGPTDPRRAPEPGPAKADRAASHAAAGSKRSGHSGNPRAGRLERRWRDMRWVGFDEAAPAAAPEADALSPAAPSDGASTGFLRHFVEPVPMTPGEAQAIAGLAPRFTRLPPPNPQAPQASPPLSGSASLSVDPAEAAAASPPETPAVAGSEPPAPESEDPVEDDEPPNRPPAVPALASPETDDGEPLLKASNPAPVPTEESDERPPPASFLTPVSTASATPGASTPLGAHLARARTALLRHRGLLATRVAARIALARSAWRSKRPLATPAPQTEPSPPSDAKPEAAEPLPVADSGDAAREPRPRPAILTHLAAAGRRIEAAALRLAGNDPDRLRTWRRVAVTAILVAFAAYLGGAMLARLASTVPEKTHTTAAEPGPGAQAAVPAPPPKPAAPPVAITPPADPAARAAFYLARAKAGDSIAQYDIGVLYARGDGLVQDFATAASWFHAAAAQGNIDAQYNLGVIYERGLGVAADATQAVNWYRSAADLNHAAAQYNLALAYAEGRGTEQDVAAAARWYKRAAEQGLSVAMINLAILYELGAGVDHSLIDAYAWYGAAGERGDLPAKLRAAELFLQFSDRDKARAEGLAATIAAVVNGAPPA
jgi:hypothetical protein